MIVQKNQLLLRFLPISLVVNGKVIYPIPRNKPVEVVIPTNPTRIVATDGFHITPPVEVRASLRTGSYYQIGCGIENDQLVISMVLMLLLYIIGDATELWFLQLLAMMPVFFFLFWYYFKRTAFIKIQPV